MTTIQLN